MQKRFRQRYKFRQFADIKSDASNLGDEQPSFTGTLASSIPCNVMDVTGQETIKGEQISAEIDAIVTMRYVSGVQHDMRLVTSNGRTLSIRSILDRDGIGQYLELHCSEVQD